MQHIVNYILRGKGYGLCRLLLFSVVLSLFFSIVIKRFGNNYAPALQNVAQQILPIKVTDGIIAEPEGIDRTIQVQLSENLPEFTFPLYFNTTVDSLDTQNLQPGIYITRRTVYSVSNDKVETKGFSGSFEIPQGDYTPFFKSIVTYVAIFCFLIMIPSFFVLFSFLSFVFSFTALILLKIFGKQGGFDFRMRLSSCSVILMYGLKYLIALTAANISFLFIAILILIFQGIFIYKGPLRIDERIR